MARIHVDADVEVEKQGEGEAPEDAYHDEDSTTRKIAASHGYRATKTSPQLGFRSHAAHPISQTLRPCQTQFREQFAFSIPKKK